MILAEMSQIVFLILGFMVLFCTDTGEAIRCYECNSYNDSRCALAVPPESLQKDCSEHTEGAKYTFCRKITQSIDFAVNGLEKDTRVIRYCGWDDSSYKNRCYQRSGFGGRQEVCACETDLCNGANTLPISATTIVLVSAMSIAKLIL